MKWYIIVFIVVIALAIGYFSEITFRQDKVVKDERKQLAAKKVATGEYALVANQEQDCYKEVSIPIVGIGDWKYCVSQEEYALNLESIIGKTEGQVNELLQEEGIDEDTDVVSSLMDQLGRYKDELLTMT